ncbi:MAG: hypothetical protein IK094_01505 [Treponema sp.]|nr:hypothetical protein [Treponema sp.]
MELITNEKERLKILRKELKAEGGWKLDSLVRCVHCGKVFQGSEMQVEKNDDGYLVNCKFSPKCSGTIIDLIDKDDEWFQ